MVVELPSDEAVKKILERAILIKYKYLTLLLLTLLEMYRS
jgi:hypothetical protein